MALSELDRVTDEEIDGLLAWAMSMKPGGQPRRIGKIVEQLREEVREYDQLFELQRKRMAECDRRWRAAHPDQDVYPDLGELLSWLLTEIDALGGDVRAAARRLYIDVARFAENLEAQSQINPNTGTHRGRMYEKHIASEKARCALQLRAILRDCRDVLRAEGS